MRSTLFLILVSGILWNSALAQQPGEEGGYEPPAIKNTPPTVPGLYGKVVDSKTNKGIEAASVQVVLVKKDTATGLNTDSLIAGMLTKPNGDFRFPQLPLPDSFSVRISALGYTENSKTVSLHTEQARGPQSLDLGNIKLGSQADMLGAVTVVAEKPTLQMGIDRKIFNVDKNITSTGGTAIDVMRNIPSVTVDVDGNVLLRNTSPRVFIDGRPTILTLQQIAADDIERIELITNPSAKFDAASTGGIINVVLKKNKRLGLNGLASLGVGTPGVLTGNLNLNLRQGKFNFFASGNYNQSGGKSKSESERQNKENGAVTDYFNQESETERSRKFTSVRFGMDYFMDNRNILTLSQNFVKGKFDNYENQNQRYLDASKTLTQTGERTSDGSSDFYRSSSQLNYTHKFPKTGQELTADITYNSGNGGNSSVLTNYYFSPDGVSHGNPNVVRNSGDQNNSQLTIQADYVNPISEDARFETGLRTYTENNKNIYNVYSVNGNAEVKLPLSTNVSYDETVHAAYATYTNKWKGIGYQAGLRAEYTTFNGLLIDSAQKFGYSLPLDIGNVFDGLFPSLFLTKQIGEGKELQVNFSRRIRRPNFWQMNPFIDINDPLNISRGNPAIRPEYTNSFELNYNQQYENGNFLGVLYFANNQDDITRYSDTITDAVYQQLNNAAIDPNAILNTYINAQYTNRMGAEFTLNHKIGNLELIPNINLQYRKVKARVGGLNLDNEGFNWESKLIFNYKLSSRLPVFDNMSFQLMANYESKKVIPQGMDKSQFRSDFALRKEFLKQKAASLTFSINDIFNTDRWGHIYDTESFYQDSYRRWNVRNFRLTFSYRFGKRDLNMFGQRNNRSGDGNDDD